MPQTHLLVCFLSVVMLAACEPAAVNESESTQSWPVPDWEVSSPEQEGLDEDVIAKLDEEFRAGR